MTNIDLARAIFVGSLTAFAAACIPISIKENEYMAAAIGMFDVIVGITLMIRIFTR